MPFRPRKRAARKPRKQVRTKAAAPSKRLALAIKQVVKKQIETKTINVPDPVTPSGNTINRLYLQGGGLQYVVTDVFKVGQGVANDTAVGSLNRIGDKTKSVGFLMDYFFHTRSYYSIAGSVYHIPFIKIRVTVFQQAFNINPPLVTQLYDVNMVSGGGATLRPIDYDDGSVRKVLYDRSFLVRNPPNDPLNASSGPNTVGPMGNCLRVRKYIKHDKLQKYMDSNSVNPNGTANPIYISIYAEVDDSFPGLVPSGTTLLYMTGRTQAWFKDA